jgi:hypothetical protein
MPADLAHVHIERTKRLRAVQMHPDATLFSQRSVSRAG